jgi:hypothetical protein
MFLVSANANLRKRGRNAIIRALTSSVTECPLRGAAQ